ncbi:disulfide bond formation protein DsbA [Streptomyces sp. NTH33]|uniref:DsbA family protein n=1 Tax=Streptomyces sp. NTH33 TaxID=1735453 RepID=UPI000DA76954|nr:DsbA family protein [Streptomyces sp. NTH33]PZH17353.1 disulfide bond formation protein DsbA [Streptomyces sp. NTH33]
MSSSLRARRRRLVLITAVSGAAAVLASTIALTGTSGGPSAKEAPAASSSSSSSTAVPDEREASLLALARRKDGDPLAKGKADAPVVMIVYSDFQCPFCGKFARETEPELVREYVDKGVLRIEWRNFPVFGDESERAARAAWAAGRQGRFWQFHDVVFGKPRERDRGQFSAARLRDMAREAGVADLDRFSTDMESEGANEAVREDQEEGYGLGVSSTPAFLVNTTPILGAQPLTAFSVAIEKAAEEAGEAAR